MTNIQVTYAGQQQQTITSLEVATMVGREHKNVMRDIEKIKGDLGQLNLEHTPYFKYSTYIHQQNNQEYPMYLLTKQGCGLYSKKLIGDAHFKMVSLVKKHFDGSCELLEVFVPERRETCLLHRLKEVLKPLGLVITEQYQACGKYRIDAVIESLGIAIEYDELEHRFKLGSDMRRQKEIEEEYGFRFVRLEEYNNDDYNIGLVLKTIMEVMTDEQIRTHN